MGTSGMAGYAKQYAPWSKNAPWWAVLAQAIVLAAIGLWILVGGSSEQTIVMLLAAYILLVSLLTIWRALRRPEARSTVGLVGAGVGLMTSLTILLTPFLPFLNLPGSIGVFGLGLVVTGLLTMLAVFGPRYGWGSFFGAVINVVIGAYIMYALVRGEQSVDLLWWIGVLSIVFGLGLGAYAALVSRKAQSVQAPVGA